MNITYLPTRPSKLIRVEADIPETQRAEFEQAMQELCAGKRPRMDALEHDVQTIRARALLGLRAIETAITAHPTSGQAKRLVRFLAGVYNGEDYPFDLTELRALDTQLANASLDYLNYDRLGIDEVHTHLANGERDLHRWLAEYGIEPAGRTS